MPSPAKHAHHLSVEIGARPPTSGAEAKAAAYAASVFESSGLEVRMEPFRGLGSFGHIYIPTTAGMLFSALAATRRKANRAAGALLGLASIAAFWGEQTSRWRPVTQRLARGPSQNVVGVLAAAGEAKRRLVIVAHLDTSRSGLAFHPKIAKDFRRNTLIGVGAGFAAIGAWLLPARLRRTVAGLSSLALANAVFTLVHREIKGIDVDGANDNASGAAVMLSLAEVLSQAPLENTEVWFVATGCEESDLVGMSAFMDRHEHELADAWFLGIDTVAGPGTTVRWVVESSILEPLRADDRLIKVAEEVAEAHPEFEAEPGAWRTAGLDTDVAAVRGLRAMSLVAQTPEGTLPNWHWPTDTYDNLDEAVLERCYGFALQLVRKFDSYA